MKTQATNKRALMVAFHFPPQAASSGIQRTLSFSRHLGQYGWEPLVLTAHPRAYSQQNPSQLASVPRELVVRRAFSLDTKQHLGIRGRYLGFMALPDRWFSWWFGAVPAGLAMIRAHKPAVIWSTFPIATAHLIGLSLHLLTRLPWVADFRDPMLQPSYPGSRLQRWCYEWIESQAIRRCSMAVFTTHSALKSYRVRFPDVPASKFVVIENGYDEDLFGAIGPAQRKLVPAQGRLTLLHSGVLYRTGRDPSAFLAALAALKQAGAVSAATLRVVLRAPGDLVHAQALVTQHGVGDLVEVAPPIPYREALAEMLAADGLLVFQGTIFNTQVPAKIYEYFRARKPILGLVDPRGETARVLGAARFRDLAHPDSSAAIEPVLRDFLARVADGTATVASPEVVRSCSRAHRTGELANVLDAVLDDTGLEDQEDEEALWHQRKA